MNPPLKEKEMFGTDPELALVPCHIGGQYKVSDGIWLTAASPWLLTNGFGGSWYGLEGSPVNTS